MGQSYSLNTLPAGPSAIETAELSDLTFEKPLGGARFLRSIRARHQHGIVVVKVYVKTTPNASIRYHTDPLKEERRKLKDIPNVLPYQKIRETATLGILVRQYVHNSLYDRISIRPFLENIEKKWIAFQLICAVRDCHARDVYHGDIKSENVMITSWGWVYLTDFSSIFKPVYLPEDNPADFSFYYDTSARRTCYVAPERFLVAGEEPMTEHVQWSMDIFSLGCVLAELFTETAFFTLSQLFKYRRGEYDPTVSLLNKIDDHSVRSLISSMIKLNPEDRWHANDYLDEYKGKAFPLYFYQHMHTLMQEITDPSSGRNAITIGRTNNGLSDDRIDRIYDDFEMLSVSLGYEDPDQPQAPPLTSGIGRALFPLQVDLPNNRHTANASLAISGDNGTYLLINVVTASLRSAARASSKVRACELFLAFAERLPDEAKLDRILPYVMPLLESGIAADRTTAAESANDGAGRNSQNEMVLVAALRTMTQVLSLISVTSPVNSSVFTQYIFPRLQSFVLTRGFKQSPVVRATYAACLANLAETASRFLDMMQALRAEEAFPASGAVIKDEVTGDAADHEAYDSARADMLNQLEGLTKVFLTDNDSSVRRAFLGSVSQLCVFFGESRASDVILSHLNTYLNDPDWMLKCAFFRTIVGVAVYVGGASVEEFILPLMLQALTDPQEFVVEQALRSLTSMAEMGLLQRAKTWELIDTAARFEVHPNMWIKEAAACFISAATTYLSMADIRILVAPLIKPYLKVPVSNLTETELLDALKKPVPRAVLDFALQWAGNPGRGVFWKQVKDSRQLSYRASNQMPPVSSVADLGPKSLGKIPKTDEDEQWLGRLRNAGMHGEDEIKVLAFREYLWRTAQRSKRDASTSNGTIYEQLVSLTKLGITPQTVIFDDDPGVYNDRISRKNTDRQTVVEALQEAQSSNTPISESSQFNGTSGNTERIDIDKHKGPPRLPDLRRQASGSGQSLSSSPSSGIGLLGKDRHRALKHQDSATRLLSGADLRNKSIAEVATNDATAAGKLNVHTLANSLRPSRAIDRNASSRNAHNYTGNDPTVLKLLDAVYVDTFPTDVAEFGPMVQPLKPGPIPSSSGHGSSGGQWRPHGQLVAVLGEHSDRVTRIIVSPDHKFFVTGSDDGTVKVWDTSRLERNVTHRAKYSQSLGAGVKVTSLCFIKATHSFVCTGSDGSVYFLKVSVSESEQGPKFGSALQPLRTWHVPMPNGQEEYAVWSEHFRGDAGSTLLLATNLGRVLGIDLRYMSVTFDIRTPAQHGSPTCFCIGRRRDFLLIGTSCGVLDLWDLRFRLRLRSWAFQSSTPITRLQLYPTKRSARRSRVCVSGGTARGEVSVWDLEKLICHEVYRPALVSHKERHNPRNYELRNLDDDRAESLLDRVSASQTGDSHTSEKAIGASVSTIVSYFSIYTPSEDSEVSHPFAITGGPDSKVRFWDCDRLEGCRLVSGGAPDEKLTYTFSSIGLDTRVLTENALASPQPTGSAVESDKIAPKSASKRGAETNASTSKTPRYEAIRLSAQHLLDSHLDTITDVAFLERPFGMILSADRSGQVFVHQ